MLPAETLAGWPPVHPFDRRAEVEPSAPTGDRDVILLLCPDHLRRRKASRDGPPVLLVCHFAELVAMRAATVRQADGVILAGTRPPDGILNLARLGYGGFTDEAWKTLLRQWRIHLKLHTLSPLELRILRDLSLTSNHTVIAARQNIDPDTARMRLRSLLQKLDLSSRTQAAVFAAYHAMDLARLLEHHRDGQAS